MKKVFLLFAFFGLFAFVTNAQVCPHASKAKTASNGQCHFSKNAAAVEYSAETGKFVNVSPKVQKTCTKAAGAKAMRVANQSKSQCTPAQKAACAAHPAYQGSAKATRVANQSKSQCTPAQKAACGAHGAKASNNSSADSNVKFVSNGEK